MNDFSKSRLNQILSSSSNKNASKMKRRSIIKMTNFPWDITKKEVLDFLNCANIKEKDIFIPMDKSTGKTKNELFIQTKDTCQSEQIISNLNKKMIKGRTVFVQSSSFTELFNTHFPLARPSEGIFLTREEINCIIVICKNFKVSTLLFNLSF